MLAKVNSAALIGLNAVPVEVEVNIASQGLPAFKKVGKQYHRFILKFLEQYKVLPLN